MNQKKLIYNDERTETWEFYDLKNDPKELKITLYEKNSVESY